MKALRFLLASGLLGSLILSQVPSPAACQMILGTSPMVCRMSCCKSMPMPMCPHMRSAAPASDRIAASTAPVSAMPIAIHWMTEIAANPLTSLRRLKDFTQTLAALFFVSPVVGRSPPPDSVLLSA
jgi:hypothetical protein